MMHVLRVPAIFWNDHFDRCAEHPGLREILGCNERFVRIRLDDEALADLESDASYYSDGVDFCGEKTAYRPLIMSARATVRALARQNTR
jgi:hypothetical protein